jgi:hypothetical protein
VVLTGQLQLLLLLQRVLLLLERLRQQLLLPLAGVAAAWLQVSLLLQQLMPLLLKGMLQRVCM